MQVTQNGYSLTATTAAANRTSRVLAVRLLSQRPACTLALNLNTKAIIQYRYSLSHPRHCLLPNDAGKTLLETFSVLHGV